jgi:hypothetical protein
MPDQPRFRECVANETVKDFVSHTACDRACRAEPRALA